MIITESFVWINYPKTASTFVRESLCHLYKTNHQGFHRRLWPSRRWMREFRCPNVRSEHFAHRGKSSPHGLRRQLPDRYRNLPVVSAVRDPVDRLLSLYHYGHWKQMGGRASSLEQIKQAFPLFPDITLEDFLVYRRQFGRSKKLLLGDEEIPLGSQSHDLLRFFADEHHFFNHAVYFESWGKLAQSLGAVRFLKTSSINSDLYQLLVEYGFPPAQVEFIKSKAQGQCLDTSCHRFALL